MAQVLHTDAPPGKRTMQVRSGRTGSEICSVGIATERHVDVVLESLATAARSDSTPIQSPAR
jgi:hypothetical protein